MIYEKVARSELWFYNMQRQGALVSISGQLIECLSLLRVCLHIRYPFKKSTRRLGLHVSYLLSYLAEHIGGYLINVLILMKEQIVYIINSETTFS